MRVSWCSRSTGLSWSRGGEDIRYRKTNIPSSSFPLSSSSRCYFALSFTFEFKEENDVTYFAYCYPYTFSMLDKHLLDISQNPDYRHLLKRKTIAESPGKNYVELLTITNFKPAEEGKSNRALHDHKKTVFVTARVHPGETPSSFVAEGMIDFLVSPEAELLRDHFVFKIIPMLNPDGVINGNYRCSLSGYDLNRLWHCDSPSNAPELYYAKKSIL